MGNYYSCDTYFGCNRNKWEHATWKSKIKEIKKDIESVGLPRSSYGWIINPATEEEIQNLGLPLIMPETLAEQKQYEYFRNIEYDWFYRAQDDDQNLYYYRDERNSPNLPWNPPPVQRHWQIVKGPKSDYWLSLRGDRNHYQCSEEMLKELGIPLIDPDKLTEWKRIDWNKVKED